MRIAVFDYRIVANNPAGACHLRLLEALSGEHDFTVFAAQFDNPCPERIEWVRVPAPRRPLALLFVSYHLLATVLYFWRRFRRRARFELRQGVESNFILADLAYAHFCHRHFLKRHWPGLGAKGFRAWFRKLDHRLHALAEPFVYRRAKRIVVPSGGLALELAEEYPFARGKISVIANPVDAGRMSRPADFDREGLRRSLGVGPADRAAVFAALGHFERKGLPVALEAMARLPEGGFKLIVAGGEADLVRDYRRRAAAMGLENRVVFAGMQPDVRPYLWAADAFLLPSVYETFSLAAFEAAAAGLPLLAPRLNGISELLKDGENGFFIEPRPDSVAREFARLMALPAGRRAAMGLEARQCAAQFSVDAFVARWRRLYGDLGVA